MADSISQDDLDNLFGDILAGLEDSAPSEEGAQEKKEKKDVEEMTGSENMTQEQIDALLKEMLGD